MPPKFGTSGLRGLVTELTLELVADHVAAFAASCPVGTGVFVARDLRLILRIWSWMRAVRRVWPSPTVVICQHLRWRWPQWGPGPLL